MTKKHILKPGKHQFAPGSHAIHDNDNVSDEEAEWYLEKYPHITALFEKCPKDDKSVMITIVSPKEEITHAQIKERESSGNNNAVDGSVQS